MTNQKAITLLEEIRPKKCKMVDGRLQGGFPDHNNDTGKAIDLAIEALEKQIPIKAEYHAPDFDVRMFSWWTCGNCDCEIASVVDKYCSYCGQRIDWNEVQDEY